MFLKSPLLLLVPLFAMLHSAIATTVGISADDSIILSRDGQDVGYFDIHLKANGKPYDRPIGKGELSFKIRTRKVPEYGKTVEAEVSVSERLLLRLS
jgi:hypothetical protein